MNWRELKNQRITSKWEDVWLYDKMLGVVVPHRLPNTVNGKFQATKIDPDFTMWMPMQHEGEEEPAPPMPMSDAQLALVEKEIEKQGLTKEYLHKKYVDEAVGYITIAPFFSESLKRVIY